MALYRITLNLSLVLFVLVLLVGCFWKAGVHLHSTPEVYTISGIIYKAYGGGEEL